MLKLESMKESVKLKRIKKFKCLTIKDDFMFCKVMQDEDICLKVLNIVLKNTLEMAPIKLIIPQAKIENHPELKDVRLDILVENEKGSSYDVEMQVVNRKNTQKRMRVYQASIDMSKMKKGLDYNKIGNTIIIFFCMFDPIGKGLPIYSFENYCSENKNIKMNDGTYKIIVNIRGWKKVEDADLKALLKYMDDSIVTNEVTKEIEMATVKIKQDDVITEEYVSMYAKYWDIRRDGERRGERRGEKRGEMKTKVNMALIMKNKGYSIEEISEISGLGKEEIEKL